MKFITGKSKKKDTIEVLPNVSIMVFGKDHTGRTTLVKSYLGEDLEEFQKKVWGEKTDIISGVKSTISVQGVSDYMYLNMQIVRIKAASAFIITCDLTKPDSFSEKTLNEYFDDLQRFHIPITIVATHVDIKSAEATQNLNQIKAFASNNHIQCNWVDARDKDTVNLIFKKIAKDDLQLKGISGISAQQEIKDQPKEKKVEKKPAKEEKKPKEKKLKEEKKIKEDKSIIQSSLAENIKIRIIEDPELGSGKLTLFNSLYSGKPYSYENIVQSNQRKDVISGIETSTTFWEQTERGLGVEKLARNSSAVIIACDPTKIGWEVQLRKWLNEVERYYAKDTVIHLAIQDTGYLKEKNAILNLAEELGCTCTFMDLTNKKEATQLLAHVNRQVLENREVLDPDLIKDQVELKITRELVNKPGLQKKQATTLNYQPQEKIEIKEQKPQNQQNLYGGGQKPLPLPKQQAPQQLDPNEQRVQQAVKQLCELDANAHVPVTFHNMSSGSYYAVTIPANTDIYNLRAINGLIKKEDAAIEKDVSWKLQLNPAVVEAQLFPIVQEQQQQIGHIKPIVIQNNNNNNNRQPEQKPQIVSTYVPKVEKKEPEVKRKNSFSEQVKAKRQPQTFDQFLKQNLGEAAEDLMCPITGELMRDPVMISSGHTFSREGITGWFEKSSICPLTNEVVDKKLTNNLTLKKQISSLETEYQNSLKNSRSSSESIGH